MLRVTLARFNCNECGPAGSDRFSGVTPRSCPSTRTSAPAGSDITTSFPDGTTAALACHFGMKITAATAAPTTTTATQTSGTTTLNQGTPGFRSLGKSPIGPSSAFEKVNSFINERDDPGRAGLPAGGNPTASGAGGG